MKSLKDGENEELNVQGMLKEKENIVAIVSATHWDRAWYVPFEQFRIKLVNVINHLLDVLKKKKNFKKFVLDGQTVVIEDYLEIMAHRRSELEKYVKEGRLLIGPFYILPDEYLVSGEAMIRNILIGQKIAESFGHSMNVGYIPDPFGHYSQLPQILNGFGIDSFLFMRGMGDEGEELGTEFIWVAPDNESKVLAIHQRFGYSNTPALGFPYKRQLWEPEGVSTAKADLDIAVDEAKNAIRKLKPYNRTGILLFHNNADHLFAQEDIGDVIEHLNKNIKDVYFVHCSFEDYINYSKSVNPKLKEYKGELNKGRYHWLLSGVYSARMYLKMENDKCQKLIERYLEPLSSFAYLEGHNYQKDLIEYVWKLLLKNHPHDDICGCSVDAVHRDMENRFTRVQQVCDVLINQAKFNIVNNINLKSKIDGIPIVIFNTLNWKRNAFVKGEVNIPYDSVKDKNRKLCLVDDKGNVIPSDIKTGKIFIDDVVYGSQKMQSISVEANVDLPSCGYKTLFIVTRALARSSCEKNTYTPAISTDLSVLKNGGENKFLKFVINDNGTINLYDKGSGIKYPSLHYFEDTEDAGDEYDYSPIVNSDTITSKDTKAKIEVVESSPVRITYKVDIMLKIPESLYADRKKRSEKKCNLDLTTYVTLSANQKLLVFKTVLFNNCKDHRLRAVFPTGLNTDNVFAESKFDIIKKRVELPNQKEVEAWMQKPMPTTHQENFVDVTDGKNGLMFINLGLPEYETKNSQNGVVYYLTLFRSVGWLSRADLLTRPNNAGPSYETPEAQCLREMEFEYAICPHKGDYKTDNVFRLAYEFKNRPLISSLMYKPYEILSNKHLPLNLSFINVDSDSIIVSAIKKSEKDDALIIRCFNLTNEKQSGIIHFYKNILKIFRTNMKEENIEAVKLTGKNSFKIDIKPKKIETFKIFSK